MKASIALVMVAVALAGCVESTPTPDNGTTDSNALSPFEFSITPPEGPVKGAAAEFTVFVNREAMVAVEAVPRHDFVGDHKAVNGTSIFEVAVEAGSQRVGVSIQFVNEQNESKSEYLEYPVNMLAEATISIDYGDSVDRDPVEDTIWVDTVNFASQSQYDEVGGTHPGYVSVHDALTEWEEQTEHEVEFGWSDRYSAFSVEHIDGEGNPIDSAAPPWWCYTVNGDDSVQGITLQRFTPGDVIHWNLGTCGQAVMT